jgi:4-hydroxy-4-methyl-2-oxoglutarate aldolase
MSSCVEADLPAAPLEAVRGHASSTVYEALGKRGEIGPTIFPIVLGRPLAGIAYTVRCFVGDAKPIWFAIAEAPAGSVIVIDCGGTSFATAIGGTSVLAASKRGIAGFVTNGSVRDVAEIRASKMPVFATGISVRGTSKSSEGWRQIPICLGHAVVSPGDLIIGDDDGVVVVDRNSFSGLQGMLAKQVAREAEIHRRVEAGEDVRDVFGLR